MTPFPYTPNVLVGETPLALDMFNLRFLAEGDSWFTVGALNPLNSSNVINELDFTVRTVIISCAYPGDTLTRMVDFRKNRDFRRLLSKKNHAWEWDGVLVSAGGNDLIDAAQVPPADKNGSRIPQDRRILLTPEEAAEHGSADVGIRYISETGWLRFEEYLKANFALLVAERDEPSSPNKGRPMFLHTYSIPTVRPSGALPGSDGWLFKAFKIAGTPRAHQQLVANELFNRFRESLLSLDCTLKPESGLARVHVFDSAGLPLVPAHPDDTGSSGDWVNEIHLTPNGYRKLGAPFGAFIESHLH